MERVKKVGLLGFLLIIFSGSINATEYNGYYYCSQGRTALTLDIKEDYSQANFKFITKQAISGEFKMIGDYSASGRKLNLAGHKWIKRPGGFSMVDLEGAFSKDFAEFSGSIMFPGCSTFKVVKEGKLDEAVMAQAEARADINSMLEKRLTCVQWEESYSTNPLFPNTDRVVHKITANMLYKADNQCEVKIKKQERKSLNPGIVPYDIGQDIVVDCHQLTLCN